jgi:hypothetical protein
MGAGQAEYGQIGSGITELATIAKSKSNSLRFCRIREATNGPLSLVFSFTIRARSWGYLVCGANADPW